MNVDDFYIFVRNDVPRLVALFRELITVEDAMERIAIGRDYDEANSRAWQEWRALVEQEVK